MRSRATLTTALAWFVAVPVTVVLSLVTVVLAPFPGLGGAASGVLRAWARISLWAARCPLRVHGELPADDEGPLVIMANHQSALDIPVMLALAPTGWRITVWAKRSLFRVPFLGWSMRAMGMLPIDRERRSTAAAVFVASLRLLRSDRSVLVFPEETYGPGDAVLPLQRGGFLMAVKAGVGVLPVRIEGTRAVLPPGGRLLHSGPIHVHVGPQLQTRGRGVSGLAELVETTRRHLARASAGDGDRVSAEDRSG